MTGRGPLLLPMSSHLTALCCDVSVACLSHGWQPQHLCHLPPDCAPFHRSTGHQLRTTCKECAPLAGCSHLSSPPPPTSLHPPCTCAQPRSGRAAPCSAGSRYPAPGPPPARPPDWLPAHSCMRVSSGRTHLHFCLAPVSALPLPLQFLAAASVSIVCTAGAAVATLDLNRGCTATVHGAFSAPWLLPSGRKQHS